MFVHIGGRGRTLQDPPCTSAIAFVIGLEIRAQRMCLRSRRTTRRSIPAPGGRGISTTVASGGRPRPSNPRWICTARCPLASRALCPRCRSGIGPNQMNTWSQHPRIGPLQFPWSYWTKFNDILAVWFYHNGRSILQQQIHMHSPEFVLVSPGHVEVSFGRNSTFPTRVEVLEEGPGTGPVPLVIPTSHPQQNPSYNNIQKLVGTCIVSLAEVHQTWKIVFVLWDSHAEHIKCSWSTQDGKRLQTVLREHWTENFC